MARASVMAQNWALASRKDYDTHPSRLSPATNRAKQPVFAVRDWRWEGCGE
jgi:hypothetical protein